MRVAIITLVLAALLGGGLYFYFRNAPVPMPRTGRAATPPPPRPGPPVAEHCTGERATYVYREDPRLTLTMEEAPGRVIAPAGASAPYDPNSLGTLIFRVHVSDGRSFPFATASTRSYPMHYLFPLRGSNVSVPSGLDALQISSFDSTDRYIFGHPALRYAAPNRILIPNLPRWLARNSGEPQIVVLPGYFDFSTCTGTSPNRITITPQPQASPP